jgi:hypothetical protein
MNPGQLKIHNSIVIIVVAICAGLGYYISSTIIKKNVIQYSSLPKVIHMKINVVTKKNTDKVDFILPVISKLGIDSLPHISKNNGVVYGIPFKSKLRVDSLAHELITNDQIRPKPLTVLDSVLFHQNPIFLVWVMLVCIMIAIAAGSFPVFVLQIWQLKSRFKLTLFQLITAFVYTIICFLFLILCTGDHLQGYYSPDNIINDLQILLQNGCIVNNIALSTILLVFPTVLIIFLSCISSDNISFENFNRGQFYAGNELTNEELAKHKKNAMETVARQFEFLNQSLKGGMQILAIIVVFSVLTSSALRMSIKSVVEIKYFDIFPIEASYVYGMYFSLFLCIMYIPSYIYLKNRFTQYKEYIDLQQFDEKWSQSVIGTVKFEGTALDNLKIAITILAPLISSFLPDSLHFIK